MVSAEVYIEASAFATEEVAFQELILAVLTVEGTVVGCGSECPAGIRCGVEDREEGTDGDCGEEDHREGLLRADGHWVTVGTCGSDRGTAPFRGLV